MPIHHNGLRALELVAAEKQQLASFVVSKINLWGHIASGALMVGLKRQKTNEQKRAHVAPPLNFKNSKGLTRADMATNSRRKGKTGLTEKRYHGKSCPKGHGTLRYKSSHNCVVCAGIRKDAQYKTNPRFRKRMLDKLREKVTGVTAEHYESMLVDQKFTCFCCEGVNPNGRQLSVDHNHLTGEVRKLLCNRCNMAIGILESRLLPVWQKYLGDYHG